MLDHHHYHSLTAQALVTQTKQEYLLEGIEAYVKAYYVWHRSVPSKLSYPLNNEEVVLTLVDNDKVISITFHLGSKLYRREVSQQ